MDHPDRLRVLAKYIFDLFNEFNICYWADYGTLLGIVRDGNIIQGDTDLDISVHEDDWSAVNGLKDKISADGFFYEVYGLGLNKGRPRNWDRIYFCDENGHKDPANAGKYLASCDLFYWHYTVGDKMYRKSYVYKHEMGSQFSYNHIENFDTIDIFGTTVNIPSDVDSFLKMRYGDWRTPKKR